jgi:S1-C subfamily serine protease
MPQHFGSAVVIARGYALTCAHVVAGGGKAVLRTSAARNGSVKTLEATLVGLDEDTDIAVLKFEDPGIPSVKFVETLPSAGARVYAVGYPGEIGRLVSRGMVCATGYSNAGMLPVEDYVVTDAVFGPGSSGGALLDASGRLIGMTSAINRLEGFNGAIGLAIPATLLADISSQMIKNGGVTPRFLGVRAGPANTERAMVMDIVPGSPADAAGLSPGDTVLSVDGQPVKRLAQFMARVTAARPDRILKISVERCGTIREIQIEKAGDDDWSSSFQGYCPCCDCCTF